MNCANLKEFIKFVHDSPTPWHAVYSLSLKLKSAGFLRVGKTEDVRLNNQALFDVFNGSLVAIRKRKNENSSKAPILIIAAHTDSPCLKLKPISIQSSIKNFQQFGVQTYGSGIWHSWLDRDLRISGLALTREERTDVVRERLFSSDASICRIPNVAIHLLRTQNESLVLNKETHLKPIFGLNESDDNESSMKKSHGLLNIRHDKNLIAFIAKLIDVPEDSIMDIDALLSDNTMPEIGGINNEFLFSPRLDNLTSCYSAIEALINANDVDCDIVVALFNNEEIGSQTDEGAFTDKLSQILKLVDMDIANRNISKKCFIVSADAAHGVHPNFSDLHEHNHQPRLDGGPVIKTNANGRYATTLYSAHIIRQAAERASIPVQEFVVRNDMACGSTVGPILSAKYGITTVDIGLPILSMHSIREMMSCNALNQFTDLLKAVIANFNNLSNNFEMYDAYL